MRIVAGLAQFGGDQRLELLGDVVLEHLGLGMDHVVGHAQRLGEVGLDQAVVRITSRATFSPAGVSVTPR